LCKIYIKRDRFKNVTQSQTSMTKNRVIHKQLLNMSAMQRRKHILATYEIDEPDFARMRSHVMQGDKSSLSDFLVRFAALIFSKEYQRSGDREQALAQITRGNVAAAFDYDNLVWKNENRVAGNISDCFRDARLLEEKRLKGLGHDVTLNNMHILRKEAYRFATGTTLDANIERSLDVWGIQSHSQETILFLEHKFQKK